MPIWMSFMFSDVYVSRLVSAASLLLCVKGMCCEEIWHVNAATVTRRCLGT